MQQLVDDLDLSDLLKDDSPAPAKQKAAKSGGKVNMTQLAKEAKLQLHGRRAQQQQQLHQVDGARKSPPTYQKSLNEQSGRDSPLKTDHLIGLTPLLQRNDETLLDVDNVIVESSVQPQEPVKRRSLQTQLHPMPEDQQLFSQPAEWAFQSKPAVVVEPSPADSAMYATTKLVPQIDVQPQSDTIDRYKTLYIPQNNDNAPQPPSAQPAPPLVPQMSEAAVEQLTSKFTETVTLSVDTSSQSIVQQVNAHATQLKSQMTQQLSDTMVTELQFAGEAYVAQGVDQLSSYIDAKLTERVEKPLIALQEVVVELRLQQQQQVGRPETPAGSPQTQINHVDLARVIGAELKPNLLEQQNAMVDALQSQHKMMHGLSSMLEQQLRNLSTERQQMHKNHDERERKLQAAANQHELAKSAWEKLRGEQDEESQQKFTEVTSQCQAEREAWLLEKQQVQQEIVKLQQNVTSVQSELDTLTRKMELETMKLHALQEQSQQHTERKQQLQQREQDCDKLYRMALKQREEVGAQRAEADSLRAEVVAERVQLNAEHARLQSERKQFDAMRVQFAKLQQQSVTAGIKIASNKENVYDISGLHQPFPWQQKRTEGKLELAKQMINENDKINREQEDFLRSIGTQRQ